MRLVVGVVGDVKAEGLGAPSIPESYVPYAQLPFAPMSVVVCTDIAPGNIVPTLTREVQSLDSALPLLHVKTLDEYVDESIVGTRFETSLLGTFGVLAFLLTVVGLYGVISYTVVSARERWGFGSLWVRTAVRSSAWSLRTERFWLALELSLAWLRRFF